MEYQSNMFHNNIVYYNIIIVLLQISIFSTRKKISCGIVTILKFKWFSKGKRNKILESITLFEIPRTNEISDKFINTANNYKKTFEREL